MKGIVFTEFLEFVEESYSVELVERLIDSSDLPMGGAYTSVGTYDASDLVTLVSRLSDLTGSPKQELLKEFGRHLFGRFVELFPIFFEGIESSLEFLPRVQTYVHLEVQKLYEDAELPEFICTTPEPGLLRMEYHSSRNLPDFAEGLILGCIAYFGNDAEVRREVTDGDPPRDIFVISRRS